MTDYSKVDAQLVAITERIKIAQQQLSQACRQFMEQHAKRS